MTTFDNGVIAEDAELPRHVGIVEARPVHETQRRRYCRFVRLLELQPYEAKNARHGRDGGCDQVFEPNHEHIFWRKGCVKSKDGVARLGAHETHPRVEVKHTGWAFPASFSSLRELLPAKSHVDRISNQMDYLQWRRLWWGRHRADCFDKVVQKRPSQSDRLDNPHLAGLARSLDVRCVPCIKPFTADARTQAEQSFFAERSRRGVPLTTTFGVRVQVLDLIRELVPSLATPRHSAEDIGVVCEGAVQERLPREPSWRTRCTVTVQWLGIHRHVRKVVVRLKDAEDVRAVEA
mmetsp:Transcript_13739/g.35257  ORF Transcript_13739/g.35257 Transcript_13739/m.35257 type:complete len:292 (+) Transcript_13739:163-1038(+)